MNKSLLLTGGTGLIGRHLIQSLPTEIDITVVTRDPTRASRLFGSDPSKHLTYVEIKDVSSVDSFDYIVNLAGEPIADKRWTDVQKKRICESRWQITDKLVALINQSSSKPSVFISGSAVGVYGRQGDTVVDEYFTDFHEEFSREVCKTWETKALAANDIRTCILRTGVVLADDGGALSKMLMPFRMGLGGKISSGNQFMPWIHIDDMVSGIMFLINHDECEGLYNFTSPNPNTNHFFSLALSRRLERPCIFTVPAFVLKMAMGESSDLVLYGQKVKPTRLLDAGFKFSLPTLDKALASLDL